MIDAVKESRPSLKTVQTLRLGGLEPESIVDGPGFRCTIFFQGCRLNCPGCHNAALQNFQGGRIETVPALIERYFSNPLLDGITLSGGEPFEQARSAKLLAQAAHEKALHVISYSGYTFEFLRDSGREDWRELLEEVDVLVDGPYKAELRDLTLLWRGSKNQRLIDVQKSLNHKEVVLWNSK